MIKIKNFLKYGFKEIEPKKTYRNSGKHDEKEKRDFLKYGFKEVERSKTWDNKLTLFGEINILKNWIQFSFLIVRYYIV